jgi:hypothetical protein
MKRPVVLVALILTALLTVATAASAAIISTSGQVVQIPPPPSVMGDLESNDHMFAFDEQQNVTLASALAVDITTAGVYDDQADLTPGTIPAGTVVNSHFVHADKVGEGGGGVNLEGTVTFDTDIVGIALVGATLDASDFLGAPGTVYPTGKEQRQIALDSKDFVIWQVDNRTVVVHSNVNAHVDQVRIITEVEVQRGGEGCTPGYWKQSHHFDSWVGYAPGDSFEAVFGRDAYSGSPTLVQALAMGGGGLKALGRHATAALLNASSGGVDYAFTTAEVISMYQAAFDGGGAAIEDTKNVFEAENEMGCPLN